MEATYFCGHVCTIFLYQGNCPERMMLGKTAYEAFRVSREPYHMTDIGGLPLINFILALWLSGQLWSGHIGDAAEAAGSLALKRHAKQDLSFLLTMWEAIEASWNPITSRRVQGLRQQRAAATAPKKPVRPRPATTCPIRHPVLSCQSLSHCH